MEQKIFEQLLEQIPSLVALILLVIYFLRFLYSSKTFIETLFNKTMEAMEENTKVLGEVSKTIGDCKNAQEIFKSFRS